MLDKGVSKNVTNERIESNGKEKKDTCFLQKKKKKKKRSVFFTCIVGCIYCPVRNTKSLLAAGSWQLAVGQLTSAPL